MGPKKKIKQSKIECNITHPSLEDQGFKAILGYTVNLHPDCATSNVVSKKKIKSEIKSYEGGSYDGGQAGAVLWLTHSRAP